MRELFKDMLINQTFRRDVFVRGVTPIWPGEKQDLFARRMVTLIQALEKIDLTFKTGFSEISGKEEVYKPIISEIAKGPVKIADLQKALPGLPANSLLPFLGLLAHGGAVGFYVPDADTAPAIAFNRIIAESVSRGAPYRYIALPGIGSGVNLDEIQWMAIDALSKGEDLSSGVAARLQTSNKSIMKDGRSDFAPGYSVWPPGIHGKGQPVHGPPVRVHPEGAHRNTPGPWVCQYRVPAPGADLHQGFQSFSFHDVQ
jgi:hypothetical protein